jgi:RNA polymerase sigma-70 factor (ECF subfamily)
MSKSDEELMAAYVAGEQVAFDALFARYAPLLLRVMRRQLWQQEDAHELVQQTFLQLHRARHDFQEGRRLRPWLMTIAFNLKREYFRKRKRKPETSLEVEPPASGRDVGETLDRRRTAQRVRRALEQLPEGQREVIEMHWLQELSFPEIAEVFGLSTSAVKVRAHRGYKKLRTILGQDVTASSEGHKPESEGET